MSAVENYQVVQNYAVSRLEGEVRLDEAIQLVGATISRTCDQRIGRLLVNLLKLTGFPSPTLADRYFFIREWAKIAAGRVRVVLVVRKAMIDPERFGMTVARNVGFDANVFVTEEEALPWLLEGAKDESEGRKPHP